ncbi:hypothetical protein QP572_00535 [Brevibacterium sp. UMB10442]|uniref:DUF6912 family protein n=1 Tax=Brevibacterium sp. UMB1308A TaxID=3050608 RepID=UPI002550CC74|nr:hypothetical protein [Brevibacterium sp. UMB1308A]MDK7748844.1 hypothetical protein [Brevibacterium sp. UMB10442]MDK8345787.1 hypothetical protein [Brevibacterium sp. UMB1308B]MDK8712783.1 hypothetical protein [Brevibacterium sp. UMB1308A]
MSVRAYFPLTVSEFRAWPNVTPSIAFTPHPRTHGLKGDALDEVEWLAMSYAAAALEEHAAQAGEGRVVLAADIPAPKNTTDAGGNVLAFEPAQFDPSKVVSAHIDDPDELSRLGSDAQANLSILRDTSLVWYDASEFRELIELTLK